MQIFTQTCADFAARYSVHGPRPQTDSISGADLHHNNRSGGADSWRLSEYRQLLQVKADSVSAPFLLCLGGFFSTHCFFCLSLISLPLPFSVLAPGFSMPLSCLGSSISKSRRRTSQGRTRLVSSLFSHYMTITSCPHAWLFLSPQVPIVIPILVLIAAIFLVLAPIIDNPQIEYLYVASFILSGIVVYIPFIHYKLCPRVLDKLTVFLQLFLEVAPADKNL